MAQFLFADSNPDAEFYGLKDGEVSTGVRTFLKKKNTTEKKNNCFDDCFSI